MADASEFLLGEFRRTMDDRYRLSIPGELADPLSTEEGQCILAKERPGCLSVWSRAHWGNRLDQSVDLIRSKIDAGKLTGRVEDVQLLGRLLSTRHRDVVMAGRGRLVVPEGFREFLGVEAGGEVLIVGAALCVEVWHPEKWMEYLRERMPGFGQLLEELSS